MYLAREIEILLCFRGTNIAKLNMFAAMPSDLMRYLGMDETVYDIGRVPTCLVARAKFCAVFIEQCRYHPPGCRHFIGVEQLDEQCK
jgi:hypothetical protein